MQHEAQQYSTKTTSSNFHTEVNVVCGLQRKQQLYTYPQPDVMPMIRSITMLQNTHAKCKISQQ